MDKFGDIITLHCESNIGCISRSWNSLLQFYENRLEAHEAVAEHLLSDLVQVEKTPMTSTPVDLSILLRLGRTSREGSESRCNQAEAELVEEECLVGCQGISNTIGYYSYAGQARLIRSLCETAGVEVDTVDGFQGREKEVIIISCVRSNPHGEIGFLADTRRMNVALTRAKRKLIVIGDSATLGNNPFYTELLSYFDAIQAYGSVWSE